MGCGCCCAASETRLVLVITLLCLIPQLFVDAPLFPCSWVVLLFTGPSKLKLKFTVDLIKRDQELAIEFFHPPPSPRPRPRSPPSCSPASTAFSYLFRILTLSSKSPSLSSIHSLHLLEQQCISSPSLSLLSLPPLWLSLLLSLLMAPVPRMPSAAPLPPPPGSSFTR